jgi:hypothetical protein
MPPGGGEWRGSRCNRHTSGGRGPGHGGDFAMRGPDDSRAQGQSLCYHLVHVVVFVSGQPPHEICSCEHVRDDTCPELKWSRESLLRVWDALQKLRKTIEDLHLNRCAGRQLDPSVKKEKLITALGCLRLARPRQEARTGRNGRGEGASLARQSRQSSLSSCPVAPKVLCGV